MAARRTLTPVSGSDGSQGVWWPSTCTWCSHTHSTTKAHKMLSTLFFKTHKTKLIVFTQTCLPIQSRETEAKKPARILTEVCTAFKGSLGSLMGPLQETKTGTLQWRIKEDRLLLSLLPFCVPTQVERGLVLLDSRKKEWSYPVLWAAPAGRAVFIGQTHRKDVLSEKECKSNRELVIAGD